MAEKSEGTSLESLADSRSDDEEMAEVVARLRPRLDNVPVADLETRVRAAWAKFANAPVRTFVPILVERDVRQAVRA